mgnify:CR=1 FL=1
MRLFGAGARLVRVLCRRDLHVFRVDRKLAFGAEGASLDLRRTAGFDDEVPARNEIRSFPCTRFMAVFLYRRAYIHLDIGAESKGLRVRERPNGGIDQVGGLLNQVFKEHDTLIA